MTPDELRALAEALDDCDPPYYESSPQINRSLDACIAKAADYLRAQADAQPVAWMYEHDGCVDTPLFTVNRWTKCEEPWNESPLFLHPAPAAPQAERAGWKWVPVEPTPEMLSAVGMMDGYDWHAPGCSPDADHANWYSAMIAAAPAVPQAEPIDPHMILAEDRFPDVPAEQWVTCSQCDGDFDRECPICDGLGRVLATDSEQAEPKREDQPLRDLLAIIHGDGGHHTEAVGIERSITDALAAVIELKNKLAMAKREPLSDERIDAALQADPAAIFALMNPGDLTAEQFKSALRRIARAVERAAYERAAQVCIETAAELRRCADGCTDGRYDWKADGADDCADAIRALGRQHD